jgi:hypothetical protein
LSYFNDIPTRAGLGWTGPDYMLPHS